MLNKAFLTAFVTLTVVLFAGISVRAEDARLSSKAVVSEMTADIQQTCSMDETAQVGFNFNGQTADITEIKSLQAAKIEQAQKIGADLGIEKMEVQNKNFNVYSNAGNNCNTASSTLMLNYNGSVSFIVTPGDKATDLLAALIEQGFNANVNYNAYRRCH